MAPLDEESQLLPMMSSKAQADRLSRSDTVHVNKLSNLLYIRQTVIAL